MQQNQTIADVIRDELDRVESFRQTAMAAGVNRQSIARFWRGETSLSLEQAQALLDHFGYRIVKQDTH